VDSMKCKKCTLVKLATDFYRDSATKSGYKSSCKKCSSALATDWKQKNKEYTAEYNKKYKLQYNYGLSVDEYNNLLVEQENRCAICFTSVEQLPRGLVVDHNHTTGKARGLLCHACNVALGMLKESEDNLMGALSYLRKHS